MRGGVPVFSAGVSARCPKAAVQAVSASAVAIVYILMRYLLLREARLALPLHDKGCKTAIQVAREHHTPTLEA